MQEVGHFSAKTYGLFIIYHQACREMSAVSHVMWLCEWEEETETAPGKMILGLCASIASNNWDQPLRNSHEMNCSGKLSICVRLCIKNDDCPENLHFCN